MLGIFQWLAIGTNQPTLKDDPTAKHEPNQAEADQQKKPSHRNRCEQSDETAHPQNQLLAVRGNQQTSTAQDQMDTRQNSQPTTKTAQLAVRPTLYTAADAPQKCP